MNDVQIFWSLCAECVEFLSQMRSGAVLMESRHGEGQTDKQGLYQRKRSDRVLTTYSRSKTHKRLISVSDELIIDTCLDGQPVKSSEKG